MSNCATKGGHRCPPLLVRLFLLLALGALIGAAPPIQAVRAGDQMASADYQVNINAATAEQLEVLPGVGTARAEAIVKLRRERGAFKSIEELLDVKGIGESGLAKMAPHVVLKGKTNLP